MRASMTPSSTIAVNPAPAGAAHSRQDHGSGFSQMLDAARSRHVDAQPEAPAKSGPAAPHEPRHRQPRAAATEAATGPELDRAASGAMKAIGHGASGRKKADDVIEAADDTRLDASDAETDEPDGADQEEVPSQIKAEQTISALMAMAPVERRVPHAAMQSGSAKPADAAISSDATRSSETTAKSGTARVEPDSGPAEPAATGRGRIVTHVVDAGKGGARVGEVRVDASAGEATATHPKQSDMNDAAGPQQPTVDAQLAASPRTGPDNSTGAGSRTAARPGAAPAAAGTAAAPIALASTAPAPARNARAQSESDEASTRKPNQPSAADAAKALSADAGSTAKPVAARKDGGEDRDPLAGRGGSKAAPEARRIEPQPAAAKVAVVGQQAVPAPTAPALSSNAAAVVATIAGEQGWRFAGAASAGSALASKIAQPMRSLKIELHPAELGAVTANLKASGGQLSVELKVENHEAYARLSADSDAIVKSLRSLGYDIDRVTIQQPQAASTVVAGSDASAGAGQFSRDASSFQPGSPGGGGERFGGQTNRQGSRNDGQHHAEHRETVQDRAGGSLYI